MTCLTEGHKAERAGLKWLAISCTNTYYHHFNWRLVRGFSCSRQRGRHSLWAGLSLDISLQICLYRHTVHKSICETRLPLTAFIIIGWKVEHIEKYNYEAKWICPLTKVQVITLQQATEADMSRRIMFNEKKKV